MRHKQTYVIGHLLEKAAPTSPSPTGKKSNEYLYTNNSAVDHHLGYEEMGVGGREREDRYNERHSRFTEERAAKKELEDIANRHKLILKKKALADSKFTTSSSNDNRLSTLWNDPVKVVESLRERCRQKPHLLGMNFPTSSTSTMGLLSEADIGRGLKMMGFDLPEKKLHLVLTVLGLHRALEGGRCIPLAQLKNAVLDKNLEEHHENNVWLQRGGGGKLNAKYAQRQKMNLGDPAVDKLNEKEYLTLLQEQEQRMNHERHQQNIVLTLSENARIMLAKLGDRFSTVRRAFRTMDKDRSGSLTRIELKSILDTFCMAVGDTEFDELMNYFDSDHDGLISYEEFLAVVRNEIQPQIEAGRKGDAMSDASESGNPQGAKPMKPSDFDRQSGRRPRRPQYSTEYSASYVKPGMLPVKSLDELKIYHDFLKKIATEFSGVSEAFMAIDIHREGYITKDELRNVLENFAFKMSKQQFDALMNVMDTNHDGKISYDEFMRQVKYCDDLEAEEEEIKRLEEMQNFDKTPAAQRRLKQMKNRTKKVTSYEFLMEKIFENSGSIHEAFKKMDKDRSGALSASELKQVLDSYAYKVPDEVFANMLGLFDADGDGEISYHEFMAQVKRANDPNQSNPMQVAFPSAYESAGGGELQGGSVSLAKAQAMKQARNKMAAKSKAMKTLITKLSDKFTTVRKAFMDMDKDRSGTLDYDELRAVIESTGYKVSDEVFEEVLEVFDTNMDGEIDYQEFLAQLKDSMQPQETGGIGAHLASKAGRNLGRQGPLVTTELNAAQKAHGERSVGAALRFLCEKIHEKWTDIRKSFRMLDWDKSGTISATELRAVLDDCCYTTSDEVFQQVIDIFDSDGDGAISYNELLDTLKKVVNGETPAQQQEIQLPQGHLQRAPDAVDDSLTNMPYRFQKKMTNIPNLGQGHLQICKAIHNHIAVISDALKRLDYDKKYFISAAEVKAAIETYCGRLNPVLWDDLLHFFDPSMTGLIDYAKFLNDIRAQVDVDVFADDEDDKKAQATSLKSGFKEGRKAAKASGKSGHGNVSMQSGQVRASAMGTGAHGSNDVEASMKFLCEKIYEKFPSIRNAFMSLDKDRGGTIGKRELKQILDDCCYTVPDETFEACYTKFDTDGDGDISYEEFMNQVKNIVEPGDNDSGGLSNLLIGGQDSIRGHHSQKEMYAQPLGAVYTGHDADAGLKFLQDKLRTQTESVRTAFRILDNDQTGSVSSDELRRVLENYCYKMNDEEFMKLMNLIDSDHDGRISYEEFMVKIGSEISFQGPLRRKSVMTTQAEQAQAQAQPQGGGNTTSNRIFGGGEEMQPKGGNRNRGGNANYKASQISFG
ncbi:hypothetical protein TL16_g10130 [Triparma laevis f. inornata]|uniref:EF-hand domain-containing protein n=1 Tax=Triparma laevis f. inornata TaxID=1714386 RepID=A0A9W7B769_9STRA|nr:hypothetical protein TL16_g10130 [Triparma laevis f. inornata]